MVEETSSQAGSPPSLAETWLAQDRLRELCADRPLESAEVYTDNPLYGQAHVIKTYARLPDRYALKVGLQHGVNRNQTIPTISRRELVPVIACYNDEDVDILRKQGHRGRLWLLANPFLYAQRLLPDPPPERRGTIYFPAHSWVPEPGATSPLARNEGAVDLDWEGLANEIADLPPERQPVTVCLYWRDVQLGFDEIFAKRGLKVVSAGHMHDRDFLFRLAQLCRAHEYAASNELGSQFFYAVASGCDFFFTGTQRRDVHEAEGEARFDAAEAFRAPASHEVQQRVADRYLGRKHMMTPRQLRRVLLHAEVLDKTAVWEPRPDGGTMLTAPQVGRRVLRRILRPLLHRRCRATRDTRQVNWARNQ